LNKYIFLNIVELAVQMATLRWCHFYCSPFALCLIGVTCAKFVLQKKTSFSFFAIFYNLKREIFSTSPASSRLKILLLNFVLNWLRLNKKKLFNKYSQTWMNNHLSTTTTVLMSQYEIILLKRHMNNDHLSTTATILQWGAFYLFIANCFATLIIGGAKELVVLLW